MYDQAAQMPIINTYVPINFQELYRIAATQKADLDAANAQLQSTLQKFGEFTSPSDIDTQRFYDLSIGQFDDLLDRAANDPDAMKDAAFRAQIQQRINSLDYGALSRLRQGAENLRQRQSNVADLISQGAYLEDWDDYADLSQYDTLNSGILEELSPVPYMNANQLSDQYFDQLKPGTIRTVYKDGVRYIETGNTVSDLETVANNHFNDLVNTPQGRMYYQTFLRQNNGDADAARQAFNNMIVASQMARTLRPTLEVDPSFIAEMKIRAARGSGKNDDIKSNHTRLDLIRHSFRNLNDDLIRESNLDKEQIAADEYDLQLKYAQAAQAYVQDPDNVELLKAREEAAHNLNMYIGEVDREAVRQKATNAYQQITNFSPFEDRNSDNFHTENHYKGINNALDAVSTDISINTDKEPLLMRGNAFTLTDDDGSTQRAWRFADSSDFMAPSTVFNMIISDVDEQGNELVPGKVEVAPDVNAVRHGTNIGRFVLNPITGSPGLIRDILGSHSGIVFENLIEGNALGSVQFIPTGKITHTGPNQYALQGKVRVPKERLEDYIGSSFLFNKDDLKDELGIREVKEKVGEKDTQTFYEFDMYYRLPDVKNNQEFWNTVQSLYANTPSYGGVGGASQAKEAQWDIFDSMQ